MSHEAAGKAETRRNQRADARAKFRSGFSLRSISPIILYSRFCCCSSDFQSLGILA